MIITDVAWIRDHRQQPVLRLHIDGYLAHIPSAQRTELLRRGLVRGVDYFVSEWRAQAVHPFILGDIEPGLTERELEGCTDDPAVLALHQEMCRAIRDGTWQPGNRAWPPRSTESEPRAGAVAHTWTPSAHTTEALHGEQHGRR